MISSVQMQRILILSKMMHLMLTSEDDANADPIVNDVAPDAHVIKDDATGVRISDDVQ